MGADGCGWGIGVCDCQLRERDPPGGAKVQGKRKRELKKIQGKGEREQEGSDASLGGRVARGKGMLF